MTSGDMHEVLAELRERVAKNREVGLYPLGLEQQLEADFKSIMEVVHGRQGAMFDVSNRLDALDNLVENFRNEDGEALSEQRSAVILGEVVQLLRSLHEEIVTIREEDTRVLRKMNHMIMNRLVMVDVLAQAIVEIESKLRNQDRGS